MKRRKLTPKEIQCRRDYTTLTRLTTQYVVRLQVEGQGFPLQGSLQTFQEAEWMRDMLAIALSRIRMPEVVVI